MLLVAGEARPAGAAGPATPASPDPLVYLRYSGTFDGTQTTKQTPTQNTKNVSHLEWDLRWTGRLSDLLKPEPKPLTIFKLTGTGTFTSPQQNCTGTFSAQPTHAGANGQPVPPVYFTGYRNPADTSKLVIGVFAPITLTAIKADDPSCQGAILGATGSSPRVEVPTVMFDLTVKGLKSKSVDGNWKSKDAISSGSSTIESSVSFDGSLGQYVALGDSFSAGQEQPYVEGGASCFRSVYAYAEVYDPQVSFWACSGATTNEVTDTQIDNVTRTTKLVTITVGGNNLVLFGHLYTCLPFRIACDTVPTPQAYAQLKIDLIGLYRLIHGRSPKARIYVLEYPNPLPPKEPARGCPGLRLEGADFVRLEGKYIPALHDAVLTLDATVKAATIASKVAKFVPTARVFDGHDVCSFEAWSLPGRR